MVVKQLKKTVISALEDMKALDIVEIDVKGKSSVTDLMIIASGSSNRHVKSCADNVVEEIKKKGMMPLGVEGRDESQWVLVDLGDIVVHIFQTAMREFYSIEELWQVEFNKDSEAESE